MKKLLLFLFIAIASITMAQNSKVFWKETTEPMTYVDSIYDANGIAGRDTSDWTKIYYYTNKGIVLQYNDLYEDTDVKYVFSIVNVIGDSLYTVQFIRMVK